MDNNEFNKLLNKRIEAIKSTLLKKGQEYGRDDRFHNFKIAAKMIGITPEKALEGMRVKHEVSIQDLINFPETRTVELINEKIGDSINYLILLEGILKEGL